LNNVCCCRHLAALRRCRHDDATPVAAASIHRRHVAATPDTPDYAMLDATICYAAYMPFDIAFATIILMYGECLRA